MMVCDVLRVVHAELRVGRVPGVPLGVAGQPFG
jgi:hypothetical protein